jgi:hypothetical protein
VGAALLFLLLTAKKIIHSKSKKQCAASAVGTKSMTEKTDCNTTRAWSVWLCVLAQAQAVPVRWRVGHHFITGKGNIYFLPLLFLFT